MTKPLHHSTATLNIKSLAPDGRFAGYASVFHVLDNQRDIVLPGAFARHLAEGHEIKLLWQHRPEEPIGRITEIFEDENGLYIEGQLALEGERAQEAYILLQEGAIKGLSIGYTPQKSSLDAATGIRELQEVDLWEVSLVTFPANDAAQVTVVKGMGELENKRTKDMNTSLVPQLTNSLAPSPQLIALSDALSRAAAILRG